MNHLRNLQNLTATLPANNAFLHALRNEELIHSPQTPHQRRTSKILISIIENKVPQTQTESQSLVIRLRWLLKLEGITKYPELREHLNLLLRALEDKHEEFVAESIEDSPKDAEKILEGDPLTSSKSRSQEAAIEITPKQKTGVSTSVDTPAAKLPGSHDSVFTTQSRKSLVEKAKSTLSRVKILGHKTLRASRKSVTAFRESWQGD